MSSSGWMLSLTWSGILSSLVSAGIGGLSAVMGTLLWFYLFARRNERKWVREHALMLLVYFRNVDWRCNEIRQLISKTSPFAVLPELRVALFKLQSDLDAFNDLATFWTNRKDHLAIWHPYSKQLTRLVEAQVELHVALRRHVSPVLSITGEQKALVGSAPGSAQEQLWKDAGIGHYLAYFTDKPDRLWGGAPVPNIAHDPLVDERKKFLKHRLKTVFDSLRTVLEDVGQLKISAVRIWNAQENANDIWFGSPPSSAVIPEAPSIGMGEDFRQSGPGLQR